MSDFVKQLFLYRVYCTVEEAFFTVWAETEPTVCPNNNTHAIDPERTTIIDEVSTVSLKDRDGKVKVQNTCRRPGLMTYFTSTGDDISDVNDVGNGTELIIDHKIGDPLNEIIYIDFNIVNNITDLFNGLIFWKGGELDKLSFSVVPTTVNAPTGENTNFALYGGYLIIPAAGDGTIDLDLVALEEPDGGLVYMPPDELNTAKTAFWNADWNSTTGKFENITAAPAGDGSYNIFQEEIVFTRFVNKLFILDDGNIRLDSFDAQELGHGFRFKVELDINGDDHDVSFSVLATLYREKTV